MASQDDPRLLYGKHVRKAVLADVKRDLENLSKPGAAVIDIGINQITAEDGTTRIVGDADTENVANIASWTTPVPGGVGPVTVAILLRNAVYAMKKQISLGWRE